MKNITLITSVINTPNIPLSYTNCRSVFSKQERFDQTKKTIQTIREKIPDNKIFLIECSELSGEEVTYFNDNVDYFFNIYDTGDLNLINRMFTISKAMGEGTMTIIALQILFEKKIEFDYLFKISGRYWLNDKFNYEQYNNTVSCIYKIDNDPNNISTCFYKITFDVSKKWLSFLLNSELAFQQCIGYESLFANFLKTIDDERYSISTIGVNGYVSVCGKSFEM